MNLEYWDDPKKVLKRRLENAMEDRIAVERQWKYNERQIFKEALNTPAGIPIGTDQVLKELLEAPDDTGLDSDICFVFKNVRFVHSQMATNPPSVNIRPSTADQDDMNRSDIADRVAKHALRAYCLKEVVDLTTLNCIVYGTGIIKHNWDADSGDIVGFDTDKDKLEMSGDLNTRPVNPWKFYIDPDATMWKDVKWVFEEIAMDWEEAIRLYPEKKDILQKVRLEGNSATADTASEGNSSSSLEKNYYDSVILYEYSEKGLPCNAQAGRYAVITRHGDVIDDLRENPHSFTVNVSELKNWPEGKEAPKVAKLPYSIMTDIDVPGRVWGKSFVEYAGPAQDYMNEMDTISLENSRMHGVARMLLPEDCDISEITDSTLDLTTVKGLKDPQYIQPPRPMPELVNTRNNQRQAIDDMSGVNESMFGQQSRETAGFAMQYATNQGNMIRHRLFIKYSMMVESMYENILQLFAEHWNTARTIKVIGEENMYEIESIEGADFAHGYDVQVEYGTSLPLDPIMRKQEIMQLLPLFEKAGRDPAELLDKLRMSDLQNMYDDNRLAKARMQEIFNRIIKTRKPQEVKEMQDHARMLNWAYKYVMTKEFDILDEQTQALIYAHIEAREALVAQRAQAVAGTPPVGAEPGMPTGEGLPAAVGPASTIPAPIAQ